MKRRNLCITKKVMAVILSASMVMSSGVTALAEDMEGMEEEEEAEVVVRDVAGDKDPENQPVEKENVESEYKAGAIVFSYDTKSEDNGEDVSIVDRDNADAQLDVKGDVVISGNSVSGVEVFSYSVSDEFTAFSKVTVGGDVKVNVESDGIGIGAYAQTGDFSDYDEQITGNEATVEVIVNKNVSIDAGNLGSTGIGAENYACADNSQATTNITVGGNVSSTAVGYESVGISAGAGSYGKNSYSTVNVTVGGDVLAESTDGEAIGVNAAASGDGASVNVTVGGDVKQIGEEGYAIALEDVEEDAEELEYLQGASSIALKVAKDVIASDTAVSITKTQDNSTMNLTVEGTVKGKEHTIVVNDGVSTKNLNITVWKVDTSNNRPIVETFTESGYKENKNVEDSINYIIRVKPVETKGGKLVSTKSTAHAGDEVYLEVTVPAGYTIDGFYNAAGAANVNVISSGGKYYLKVPAGGGVDVGVRLSRIDSGDGGYSDSDYSSNKTNSGLNEWLYLLQGLQIHAITYGGVEVVRNVADLLVLLDKIAAINNFPVGVSTMGTDNVMGSGVLSFNNAFLEAMTATVDVPVPANVVAGLPYTVMFSDGSSVSVTCAVNGILTIPVRKDAEGLTYIIYGVQVDPSMFIGVPATSEWTY